jgi:membrane-bound ClpP family serine protease
MWLYELFGFLLRFDWISAICFIMGFILIIVEVLSPGFGVPGISGIILLILGIMFTARGFLEAIVMIALVLIIIGVLLVIFFRLASKGKLNNKIILVDKMNKEAGFVGRSEPHSFLGKEGITVTMLRPAGSISIDGTRLDVVTDGEFIPKGTKVRVVKVEGIRIIVEKVE